MDETDAEGGQIGWNSLPEHIIVNILSNLEFKDKYNASLVCKAWNDCFHYPSLWTEFCFRLESDDHENQTARCMTSLEYHGNHFKNVVIKVDQSSSENRTTACKIIEKFTELEKPQLSSIKIEFVGENPLFYAGAEFNISLKKLFGTNLEMLGALKPPLQHVDLSCMLVAYNDEVFNVLSANHPNLQSLNILNKNLICKVTPDCILNFVNKCRKLKSLAVFHCSMSDEILLALAEEDRAPLRELSIACRREDKYCRNLSSEAWQQLVASVPDLKVSLLFDETCPLHKVSQIMKREIPVHVLKLQTFTMIYSEVRQAASYYSNSLEVVVLQTRYSHQLGRALIYLAQNCPNLHTLIVYCVLSKEVVDEILKIKPQMREKGTYILRWKPSPEPWVVGVEDDYF